ERHVAAQPIQLGDDDRALASSGIGQRGGKPRPAIKRVGAFAGLDLGKFGGDGKALATGKLRVRRTLRLKAEAGAALLLRGDADVGDYSMHCGQAYGRLLVRSYADAGNSIGTDGRMGQTGPKTKAPGARLSLSGFGRGQGQNDAPEAS